MGRVAALIGGGEGACDDAKDPNKPARSSAEFPIPEAAHSNLHCQLSVAAQTWQSTPTSRPVKNTTTDNPTGGKGSIQIVFIL